MRLFHLLICLVFISAAYGDEDTCEVENSRFAVDENFIDTCGHKKKWTGAESSELDLKYLDQGQVNRLVSHVTSITNVKLNVIDCTFGKLVFANLETWSYEWTTALDMRNCQNLTEISFPMMKNPESVPIWHQLNLRNIENSSLAALREMFPRSPFSEELVCDSAHIRRLSELGTCTGFNHVMIDYVKTEPVDVSVNYIHNILEIIDSELYDLSFLKLDDRHGLNPSLCSIQNNLFCVYDEVFLTNMIMKSYKTYTIAGNEGGHCDRYVCTLNEGTHYLDAEFVRNCGDKFVMSSQNGTELVIGNDVTQKMVEPLVQKWIKVENVKLIFLNCQLNELNFAELKEWLFVGEVAMVLRECPMLKEISFPKIGSSPNRIDIVEVEELSSKSLESLQQKFQISVTDKSTTTTTTTAATTMLANTVSTQSSISLEPFSPTDDRYMATFSTMPHSPFVPNSTDALANKEESGSGGGIQLWHVGVGVGGLLVVGILVTTIIILVKKVKKGGEGKGKRQRKKPLGLVGPTVVKIEKSVQPTEVPVLPAGEEKPVDSVDKAMPDTTALEDTTGTGTALEDATGTGTGTGTDEDTSTLSDSTIDGFNQVPVTVRGFNQH